MTRLIEFYRGNMPNMAGVYISQIWDFRPGEFEMDHDWVQWLFPSNEPSSMNCDAPTLTKEEAALFQNDPVLNALLKFSFVRVMHFMGFKVVGQGDGVITVEPDGTDENRKWLSHFNHNMLRATRIMKSLRACGLTQYAIAFYDALRPYRDHVSANTWKYWTEAVFNPIWID